MAGQREKINWMDPNQFMWGPSKTEQLSPDRARGQQIMESQGADKAADYWRQIEAEKAAKNAYDPAAYKAWEEDAYKKGLGKDDKFWDWLMIQLGIKKR